MGFLSLLGGLPALISGLFGTVNGITAAISNAKIAQINATTQEEQIHASERVQTLSLQRDALIAESAHSPWIGRIQFLLALGPVSVLLKILTYDKALGQWTNGHTDALDPNLWNVVMVVLGFYFLSATTTSVVGRILAARSK